MTFISWDCHKTMMSMRYLNCGDMKPLFIISHKNRQLYHLSYTPSCLCHLICTSPPQNKQLPSHPISCIAAVMNLLWFHNTFNYSTLVKIAVHHLEPLWFPFLPIACLICLHILRIYVNENNQSYRANWEEMEILCLCCGQCSSSCPVTC